MNKRDIDKLIIAQEKLSEAAGKLFLVYVKIATQADDIRKLVRKYKQQAAKEDAK